MTLAFVSADTEVFAMIPVDFIMILECWVAATVVFTVIPVDFATILAFLNADAIVLTVILVWHSCGQIPLFLQ